MIVCLCHGVSDRTIRGLIQEGASSVDDIAAACGAGTGCGSCKTMVAKMVKIGATAELYQLKSVARNTESPRPDGLPGGRVEGSKGSHRAA